MRFSDGERIALQTLMEAQPLLKTQTPLRFTFFLQLVGCEALSPFEWSRSFPLSVYGDEKHTVDNSVWTSEASNSWQTLLSHFVDYIQVF